MATTVSASTAGGSNHSHQNISTPHISGFTATQADHFTSHSVPESITAHAILSPFDLNMLGLMLKTKTKSAYSSFTRNLCCSSSFEYHPCTHLSWYKQLLPSAISLRTSLWMSIWHDKIQVDVYGLQKCMVLRCNSWTTRRHSLPECAVANAPVMLLKPSWPKCITLTTIGGHETLAQHHKLLI